MLFHKYLSPNNLFTKDCFNVSIGLNNLFNCNRNKLPLSAGKVRCLGDINCVYFLFMVFANATKSTILLSLSPPMK